MRRVAVILLAVLAEAVSFQSVCASIPRHRAFSRQDVQGGAVSSRAYDPFHGGAAAAGCAVEGGPTNSCVILYDGAERVREVSDAAVSAAYRYADGCSLATSVTVSAQGYALRRSAQWDWDGGRPASVDFSAGGTGAVASFGYQYAPGSGRVARETREDGSSRTFAYDGRGRLTDSEGLAEDGATPSPGRRFGWAYDGFGNTVRAGPSGAPGGPRYSFECDARNVHVSRVWGSVFEVCGTAATGATVTVCGRVAEDGFYAYFSCADGGPVTNASLGLLERVRRKSEPHR